MSYRHVGKVIFFNLGIWILTFTVFLTREKPRLEMEVDLPNKVVTLIFAPYDLACI